MSSVHPKKWNPVLSKTQRLRVISLLKSTILEPPKKEAFAREPRGLTLAGGLSGIALYLGFKAKIKRDPGALRFARNLNRFCLTHANSSPSWGGLFEGRDGPRAVQALLGSPVAVTKPSRMFTTHQNFDLISGSAGIGISQLISSPLKMRPKAAKAMLQKMISRRKTDGVRSFLHRDEYWMGKESWDEFKGGRPIYDYGIAHGTPGILTLLAAIATHLDPKASELLSQAKNLASELITHLERHRRGSNIPHILPTRRKSKEAPGRIAWCYGDLSYALGLIHTGSAFGEKSWLKIGIKIAVRASKRTTPKQARLGQGPAFLCHGSAGNAQIFSRLYQWTGRREFKRAAQKWYGLTLRFLQQELRHPIHENGFLNGVQGSLLVLHSAIHNEDPRWDCLLGISLP